VSEPDRDSAEDSTVPPARASRTVWNRIVDHKVIQWSVAYLGAALALAQGQELLAGTFGWPGTVSRAIMIVLISGLPVAVTVAWYHGHRGLQRVTPGELGIISVLLLIGALFFGAAMRPYAARDAGPLNAAAVPNDGALLPSTSTAADASRPETDRLPDVVAVLPFRNLSPDEADAFFAQSLHEELILQLGGLRNLDVISRTSVMRYAETSLSAREIALSQR
jgi:hypothetical protein